ncbi:MAG: hypothetical protein ACI4I6_08505 [Hominimerdicola sp.]
MKRRNINRGLVLGAILIVGSVGYVVYDNAAFKKEKPEIQQTVEAFVQKMSDANLGTKEDVKNNWTQIVYENFSDYTPNENSMDYFLNDDNLLSDLGYKYDNCTGKITKSIISIIGTPKIQKTGPNGATVTFDYSLYLEAVGGTAEYVDFWGTSATYCWDGDISPSKSYKFSESGHAVLYFEKADDEWKIGYIQSDDFYENDFAYLDGEDDSVESDTDGKTEHEELVDSSADSLSDSSENSEKEESSDGE